MTDRSVMCYSEAHPISARLAAMTATPSAPAALPPTEHGRRTREALLDAGVEIAEQAGLAGLSVNAVVAEAGLAKGTFYVHFADRGAFVDAIHERFYAAVGAQIAAATADLEPGAERLIAGIEAYLDACLASRGVKALLLDARGDGNLTALIDERQALFAALAAPNLEAMGRRDAKVAARLLIAAASEAALVELERGRRGPGARRALREMIGVEQSTETPRGP
jgi:AcrR family transcriptional regulator